MEDTLSKFMSESAKRHEENSNLIKEIRATTDAAIRNQGASIKTLEIQIGQMSKVLQERGFGSLPSSTETNPRDQVKLISTIIEADSYPMRRIGASQYVLSVSVIPLSTYLNLGLGELAHTRLTVELADRTVKYPKGIAENMLVVLENMDAYHDEGMGDVIFGEPFLRKVGIKTRRFEGMITIYNGNDKVSEEDNMNGISHPYQNLKEFYKGVLNLGTDYIRDAKMEEWLTRGHISVHEMEW
ncbi:hypothetical protein Tco_1409878 [Tanacetum coccineum]